MASRTFGETPAIFVLQTPPDGEANRHLDRKAGPASIRGSYLSWANSVVRPLAAGLDNSAIMIRLIVGLGNPGPEYAATRHNAGFWFVDALARRLKVSLAPERAYSGFAARANVAGQTVWLLEPTTFM